MIRRILFPVDFSPSCTAMAPFVKRAAEVFAAKVTVFHVVEPPASGFDLLVRPMREIEADLEQAAAGKLNSFLKAEFPGKGSERLLLTGDPAVRIAEMARDRGFDLITMPTHAGVFRRTLLGSTTAKVLNGADCPVLTTRHAEAITPRPLEHREWVCAVGLQPDSERVLRQASEMAKAAHANLTLVHAIPSVERGLPVQLDLDELVQSAERIAASRRIEALQRAVAIHARIGVAIGPVRDALVDAASRLKADVLVIGRSPQPGSAGRLRDLTYAIVRDAPCPVVSV